MSWPLRIVERGVIPDPLLRHAIRRRVGRKLREERALDAGTAGSRTGAFAAELREMPIAMHTDEANEQHYELPPEFFQLILGEHLKYSSALFEDDVDSLDQAEARMLDLYLERGRMKDGQDILELGCGWGSLTLHMAQRLPASRILAVSNSRPQRDFIRSRAEKLGIRNVEVLTEDINRFSTGRRFDRVVSIEMFEHMKNYELLLQKVAAHLREDGLLFIHVFAHRCFAYHYVAAGPDDWMARYFFTGGTMPSVDLFRHFPLHMEQIEHWVVSGTHYQKTANAWLENMDAREARVREVLAATYGPSEEQRWWVRWRLFFMACAELFGYADGTEWVVSHHLFRRLDQSRPRTGAPAGA